MRHYTAMVLSNKKKCTRIVLRHVQNLIDLSNFFYFFHIDHVSQLQTCNIKTGNPHRFIKNDCALHKLDDTKYLRPHHQNVRPLSRRDRKQEKYMKFHGDERHKMRCINIGRMGRQSYTQQYGGSGGGACESAVAVSGIHFRVIKCDGKCDEIFHYMLNRTRGENKSAFYDAKLPPPHHH